VTPSLTGQRSRSELIAELYERHAAGLFAYCHDQLGEMTSASDAVVAVFTGVPIAEPPQRAALYALARREIYRRDISYALPFVDPVADPATALIERVFRDIRPHQREVLLLSALCGLDTPELAVVLDVALDTAEELTAVARRRFTRTLASAVAAARSAPYVAAEVAEVYGAIGVAPLRDVLARLPWRRPAAAVRDRVLSALPYEEPGTPAVSGSGRHGKKLWPTPPAWPLPPVGPGQAGDADVTNAGGLDSGSLDSGGLDSPGGDSPRAAGSRSEGRRRAKHEATTEPMPKLRGSLLNALGESRTRRRRASGPALAAPIVTDTTVDAAGADTDVDAFKAFNPSDTFDTSDTFDAFRPVEVDERRRAEASLVETPAPLPLLAPQVSPNAQEALMPPPVGAPAEAQPPGRDSASGGEPGASAAKPVTPDSAKRAGHRAPRSAAARRAKNAAKRGGRRAHKHYDWLWELVTFLICVVLALIVFLATSGLRPGL
jgi:DNA-directed RNA polymerase specialized sigma24 family protein